MSNKYTGYYSSKPTSHGARLPFGQGAFLELFRRAKQKLLISKIVLVEK